VAFYQGKLLGATSRGVTASEIRIVIPCNPANENASPAVRCTNDGALDIKAFTAFFNERFQFYGRKLTVIRYKITTPLTVTSMIRDAQAVEALKPFAVMDYLGGTADKLGTSAIFFRELSRRKIVNISGLQLEAGTSNVTQAELQSQAPYGWTYQPTADMVLAQIGDLICTSLVKRKPYFSDIYQGVGEKTPTIRKFGIAVPATPSSSANLGPTPLTRRLDSCKAPYQTQNFEPAQEGASKGATELISKFHSDGVTTVVPLSTNMKGDLHFPASQLRYYPEWITSNIYGADAMTNAVNISGYTEENRRMFGIRSDNKAKIQVRTYNYQAVKEYDSNYTCCDRRGFYQAFMLLSGGIQMAGPNLTPETFQQALYDTSYPGNNQASQAPDWHSRVDFGPGDHTMQSDFQFQFVNQQEFNNDFAQRQGTYCAVERGIRFGPGELKRPLTFFNGGAGLGSAPCM